MLITLQFFHQHFIMANAASCRIRAVDLQQYLGPLPVPDDGMGKVALNHKEHYYCPQPPGSTLCTNLNAYHFLCRYAWVEKDCQVLTCWRKHKHCYLQVLSRSSHTFGRNQLSCSLIHRHLHFTYLCRSDKAAFVLDEYLATGREVALKFSIRLFSVPHCAT